MFSEKQLSLLASELANMPVTESTSPTLLKLTAAVLVAGDMALWMGPGRRIIERAWDSPQPDHGLTLCGALADLGWGGWKMIAVPSLAKVIPPLLHNAHGGLVLHLLASLRREGKLWELNFGCRTALEEYVCARLGKWEKSEESVSSLSFASGRLTISFYPRHSSCTICWNSRRSFLPYHPLSCASWKRRCSAQTQEKITNAHTQTRLGSWALVCSLSRCVIGMFWHLCSIYPRGQER